MLFDRRTLERVSAGEVTVAVRRWNRPTVRAGGHLRTAIGVLAIESVDDLGEDVGALNRLPAKDVTAAGFQTRDELIKSVTAHRHGGRFYRIAFHLGGDDPRTELRERSQLTTDEIDTVTARLTRFDQRSKHGPWTLTTLRLIADNPGVRAADLAGRLGRETLPFKTDVRKLKELGLTESLEVGYRVSPRGNAILATLETRAASE